MLESVQCLQYPLKGDIKQELVDPIQSGTEEGSVGCKLKGTNREGRNIVYVLTRKKNKDSILFLL